MTLVTISKSDFGYNRTSPATPPKENPTLIAACLVYGEKMQLESAQGFHNLLETVVLSIFGQSCATQNQTPMLEFIQCLMLHQIDSTERPRQALKRGAFISTYRLLVEALPESRLFLTAALYQPIVRVTTRSENFEKIRKNNF